MAESDNYTGNIIWNYCSSCRRQTKHTILFDKVITDFDETIEVEFGVVHSQIIECNGCETVSFRRDIYDFIAAEDDEDHIIETYPNDIQNYQPLIGIYYLPPKIKDVYNQTLLAFKGRSHLLAGVGFRAIIESICIEEKIKGYNLEQKINNLVKNKLITEKEADRLHSIRFLGNDAVHEMETPAEGRLYLVLNIIDNLLKNLYIIDRDVKITLDSIIKDFPNFEELLMRLLPKYNVGDEKTLKEILGKHIRQINIELSVLESYLVEKINEGLIDYLSLGSSSSNDDGISNKQHFIIKTNDFLPF